ncbi:adenylate/guanylate cyclase domain-containing protein [Stappia sp. F7233]|uniref:Adenylate/guanylate cyclase domain-containing protein n=1 Tax=Stappia albiluteola TaxID=2758565 RepID=A0A839AIH0_9HYPH|nr:adenylate/guanylate cyclase domain-containing protein [Stappia albiluteola]MBA5778722.1 adenylate/guanylate cyclase domain-containing protein [Stappia albiluteola]
MQTTPALEEIEDWLIREALGSPDVAEMFAGTCHRLRRARVPVDRSMLTWATLHPLIEAESALWLPDRDVQHEAYLHREGESDEWLQSPIRAVMIGDEPRLRRRLADGNSPIEFPLCRQLAAEGFTDYLVIATAFHLPFEVEDVKRTGIIVSWATTQPGGFTDEEIDAIEYIQLRLGLACRAAIQSRIAENIAHTYLGRRAGHQVLSGRIRHGDGDLIDAVIFYCDMRDSTRIAEELGPKPYLQRLNAYFDATAGAVIAEGGEILDFIGDAVLAVFPIDGGGFEEAARRALAAVAGVHERLDKVNEGGDVPLRCGVALSRGQVMFGNIGIADRLTFSVIGQTVNAAARMEALTKELGLAVLVTAEIAEVAQGDFQPAGMHTLAGMRQPISLFSVGWSN